MVRIINRTQHLQKVKSNTGQIGKILVPKFSTLFSLISGATLKMFTFLQEIGTRYNHAKLIVVL